MERNLFSAKNKTRRSYKVAYIFKTIVVDIKDCLGHQQCSRLCVAF